MIRICLTGLLLLAFALTSCGGGGAVLDSGASRDANATTETKIVWSNNQQGWFDASIRNADTQFVTGPATPPLGNGSLQLTTGADLTTPLNGGVGGKAIFATEQFNGTLLGDLTALSYSTYQEQVAATHQHLLPGLNVQVDVNNDGLRDTTLVFEPVYVPEQGAVVPLTWQTWDTLSGDGWWNTKGIAGFPGGGSTFFSIDDFVAAYPDATIVTWYQLDNGYGFNFTTGQNSGGFWSNFIGYVDGLTFTTEDGTIFDFENPGVDDLKDSYEALGFKNYGQAVKFFKAHGQNGDVHRNQ